MNQLERVFRFRDSLLSTCLDSSDKRTIWYRLTHVCRILGFSNPNVALKTHCRKRYREIHAGKGRAAVYVQRSDVIRLTFASKKEYAEAFQDWAIELIEEYWDNGIAIAPDITPVQAIAAKERLDRILNTPSP